MLFSETHQEQQVYNFVVFLLLGWSRQNPPDQNALILVLA